MLICCIVLLPSMVFEVLKEGIGGMHKQAVSPKSGFAAYFT